MVQWGIANQQIQSFSYAKELPGDLLYNLASIGNNSVSYTEKYVKRVGLTLTVLTRIGKKNFFLKQIGETDLRLVAFVNPWQMTTSEPVLSPVQ